jgi:secondary thiamine-phosphate synthase enzyme
MKTITIRTRERCQLVDITSEVKAAVRESQVQSGLCVVFCPHTTGAITINENADPDVVRDLVMAFEKVAPPDWPYRHGEGNSDAHLKSALVGASEHLLIEGGALVLGTWQGIYFCEFDGPRSRQVHIQVLRG